MGHLTHNLLEGGRLLHLFLVVQCDFLAELSRIRSHVVVFGLYPVALVVVFFGRSLILGSFYSN